MHQSEGTADYADDTDVGREETKRMDVEECELRRIKKCGRRSEIGDLKSEERGRRAKGGNIRQSDFHQLVAVDRDDQTFTLVT